MVVATNTGEFMGRAGHLAAGHRSGLNVFRIHNGKVVEMWVAQDSWLCCASWEFSPKG